MSALTVIVAPAGPAQGVLDVLQDWTALGLVDSFLWVDSASCAATQVPATVVREGRQHGTSLQAVLSRKRVSRIRVCVLVPLIGSSPSVPDSVESQVAELASATSGGARIQRIRLILTRPDSGEGTGDLAHEGWHNVLIAPEDSRGPGLGHTLLTPTQDPVTIGRDASGVIAGTVGLWRGLPDSPLDDKPMLPGATVIVARSFFRGLDATDAEHQLRRGVISMREGLPRPRLHGVPAVYIEDFALATSSMAQAWWTKHGPALLGPRSQPPNIAAPATIGLLAAFRMLFSFLASAIRSAPLQWYARVLNRVASEAARRTHHVVFGSAPAAYEVVVNGLTKEGLPVGWAQLGDASDELDSVLRAPDEVRTHEPHADLSGVWRDFVAGALTLADGGERAAALPPVQVGTDRGVMRQVSDCAPHPREVFDRIPGHVRAAVEVDSVHAADTLGIRNLRHRLRQCTQDPQTALDAERTAHELDRWARSHADSYAAQVGALLGRQLLSTAKEVRQLLMTLAEAGNVDRAGDPAALRQQRKLARWIVILLLVATAGLIALLVLGILQMVGWTIVLALAAGVVLAWLVGSFVVFLESQRAFFQEVHRRREAAGLADVAKVNLRHGLRDLRRLTQAYGQFLSWSRVLGAVLSAPFGDAPLQEAAVTHLGGGLALHTGLGEVTVEPTVLARAVTLLRRDLFSAGWLTTAWEASLDEAGQRLGPSAYDFVEQPQLMFRQQGVTQDSPLNDWATLLATEGPSHAGGAALWSKSLESLASTNDEVRRQLVSTIRLVGERNQRPLSFEDFMAGVDSGDGARPEEFFDAAVLTTSARMAGKGCVATTWSRSAPVGLGRVAVLTQLSEGLPDYSFVCRTRKEPPPRRPVDEDHWNF